MLLTFFWLTWLIVFWGLTLIHLSFPSCLLRWLSEPPCLTPYSLLRSQLIYESSSAGLNSSRSENSARRVSLGGRSRGYSRLIFKRDQITLDIVQNFFLLETGGRGRSGSAIWGGWQESWASREGTGVAGSLYMKWVEILLPRTSLRAGWLHAQSLARPCSVPTLRLLKRELEIFPYCPVGWIDDRGHTTQHQGEGGKGKERRGLEPEKLQNPWAKN